MLGQTAVSVQQFLLETLQKKTAIKTLAIPTWKFAHNQRYNLQDTRINHAKMPTIHFYQNISRLFYFKIITLKN